MVKFIKAGKVGMYSVRGYEYNSLSNCCLKLLLQTEE